MLLETPLSPDQILYNMGTSAVHLTASVADTKELRAWLRGFGHMIRVLEPPGILDQI